MTADALPLVTAIVSTYAAERFIRGCLDDLVAQTLFARTEVIVIDSGSPQNESAICEAYAQQHPQIRLLRTPRETLYAAWNRAIAMARGKYLTNANTDDRHAPEFLAVMVQALESRPDVALVYADQWVSEVENETFAQCEQRAGRRRRWPDFTPDDLMLRCITGSQPVWRRALHDAVGLFDTRYRIAADYEMWLRIAAEHDFLHIARPLGVLYDSPATLSGANNRLACDMEVLAFKPTHLAHARWRNRPGLRRALAGEWFSTGYRYIGKHQDGAAAAPFIREAIRLDPWRLSYRKTYALRCLTAGLTT